MEYHHRSHTVKTSHKSSKKIDFSLNLKNSIKEELESSKEYNSDTQEEINNDEEPDVQIVSKFQFYFEAIITIILCFHSYLIYSYLNVIHVCFIFILTFSRYETEYTFLLKNKKTLMIILVIIDSVYLVIKSIFFIIFALENSLSGKLKPIYPSFVIKYDWQNYFEYVMVFIIIVLLLVNLIIGEFDYNFWKNSILPKTMEILQKESINNNTILNLGIFYISLGAALYPSVVNLAILVLGLLFFFSLLFKQNFRFVMKKYISIIMIFSLPVYTIIDYMLNSKEIMEKIDNIVCLSDFY